MGYKPGDYPYQEVSKYEDWRQYGVPFDATPDELGRYWNYINSTYPYQYSGPNSNAGWSRVANGPVYTGHTYPGYNQAGAPVATTTTASAPATQNGAPIPQQATAFGGHGGTMPSKKAPAAQQNEQTSNGVQPSMWPGRGDPFSDWQWAYLNSYNNSPYGGNSRVGSYFGYNGTNYSNQYNYLGGTLGQANRYNPFTGQTGQASGSEQLNRYGQPLGTLGPLNNRRTMTMQFFNGSGTNPDKVQIVGPRFNTPGGGIPGSHNTGGIKPVKNNNSGGSNTYNDLINWRI